jgi:hypothetical protein
MKSALTERAFFREGRASLTSLPFAQRALAAWQKALLNVIHIKPRVEGQITSACSGAPFEQEEVARALRFMRMKRAPQAHSGRVRQIRGSALRGERMTILP